MWVNNSSALFARAVAFAVLFLLGLTRIYAADEQSVYPAHLTALTDDPVFEEYLRNLKREAAIASTQPTTKPVPDTLAATHQPRVIEVPDDSEGPTAAPSAASRFIFTSIAAKPVLAKPGQVNASSTSEAALLQNAAARTAQIEHLRQRASGSKAQ
jgi:hypothetical protein